MCSSDLEPLILGETVRLSTARLRGDLRPFAKVRQSTAAEDHYFAGLERMEEGAGGLSQAALRDLFDGVPGAASPPRASVWTTFGVTAAAMLVCVGLIFSASGLIDRASAAGQTGLVPRPAAASNPEVPEPPPLYPPRLVLRATNITWVTACADGRKVFERLFRAGDTAEIPFAQTALLRSGNAGGLEVALAGQSFEPMGTWGAIRMLRATPERYDYIPPVITGSCLTQ